MESFTSFKPKDKVLQNYIDTFYFHKTSEKEGVRKIAFFPNTKNALTIYKNAKCIYLNYPTHFKIVNSYEKEYSFFYLGIQKSYCVSEMENPFNKIGIIFKPLGINYFLDKSFKEVCPLGNIEFNYFEKSLTPVLSKVYIEENELERVALLEAFFLNQLQVKDELNIIHKAISIIEDGDDKLRVNGIAQKLQISSKTLNRKFSVHMNCTPKQYSNVYFFRKATEEFKMEKKKKNLTALAINNNYFDQSDFIRYFKRFTGQTPTQFFKGINDLGDNIYWIID